MSVKRAKRTRKGFEGGKREEVAGINLGVPQHASLFSPVASIPPPPPPQSARSQYSVLIWAEGLEGGQGEVKGARD